MCAALRYRPSVFAPACRGSISAIRRTLCPTRDLRNCATARQCSVLTAGSSPPLPASIGCGTLPPVRGIFAGASGWKPGEIVHPLGRGYFVGRPGERQDVGRDGGGGTTNQPTASGSRVDAVGSNDAERQRLSRNCRIGSIPYRYHRRSVRAGDGQRWRLVGVGEILIAGRLGDEQLCGFDEMIAHGAGAAGGIAVA